MEQISIIIDEQLKYTIDLKNEFKPDEFISIFEEHISKVKKLLNLIEPQGEKKEPLSASSDKAEVPNANELFRLLNAKVESLGKDLSKRDKKTTRTFNFERPINSRSKGLVWLQPIGQSLVVYLRKGDHRKEDKDNRIVYKKTWGSYPMLKLSRLEDVDYAFNIIKKIYSNT
jgi:hypothetical protein